MNQPRGIRNNNPLNIRKSSSPWMGKIRPSTDRDFEQFSSIVYGLRAAFRIMATYANNYGVDTIEGIVRRWAPPSENRTDKYITTVSCLLGMPPTRRIPMTHKKNACALVGAMAFVECGVSLSKFDIERAYNLAFPQYSSNDSKS